MQLNRIDTRERAPQALSGERRRPFVVRIVAAPHVLVQADLRAGRAFARDYYPLERLLAYAVAISATIAVVATIIVSSRHGGFDAALNSADEALTPMLESLAAEAPLPRDVDLHKLARLLVLAAPPVVAASTLLMLMLNLWTPAPSTLRRCARPVMAELLLPGCQLLGAADEEGRRDCGWS